MCGVWLAAALVVGQSHTVVAQDESGGATRLDEGLVHFREGRFSEARLALRRAEADPSLTPNELVELHLYAGALDQLQQRIEDADVHYLMAMALDPQTQVPSELGPSVAERVTSLREIYQPRRLDLILDAPSSHETTSPTQVVLRLVNSPPRAVATVELSANDWQRRMVAEPQMIVDVPPEAWGDRSLSLEALARSSAGAVLDTAEAIVEPVVEAPDGRRRRRWIGSMIGVACVVVAAIVVGVAVANRDEQFIVGAPGP